MMKKTFFWLFLIVLSFNNMHLFAFEKNNFNEASNDSILKTENISKLLETRKSAILIRSSEPPNKRIFLIINNFVYLNN